jgi:hypothetical protein
VAGEDFAQHPPMLDEQSRVTLTVLVEQPRRALDVGEQKRDRAGRKLCHQRLAKSTTPEALSRLAAGLGAGALDQLDPVVV